MNKSLLVFILIVGAVIHSFAQKVDQQTAKLAAKAIYKQINPEKANKTFQLICASPLEPSSSIDDEENEVPSLYMFNVENNNGFVIVSGDKRVNPILGYSIYGNLDVDNLPSNFKHWIEGYEEQIKYVVSNDIKATKETIQIWKKIEKEESILTFNSITSVNPLLFIKWNQSPYENALCPYDSEEEKRCLTGCVATAMAQIMKYWEYPKVGTGSHSYNHPKYGNLSASFGSTTYNWSSMPNSVNNPNNAVATLMYHCGVSVEMDYGPSGSGAYSYKVKDALIEYFNYAPSMTILSREDYSFNKFVQLLKKDLNEGRPIKYSGRSENGERGHAFVCDGYKDNYFHFNWGWGGHANGFFALDALNPSNSDYSFYESAIIGIKPPPENIEYELRLYDDLVVEPTLVWYGQSFKVHTNISNKGTKKFVGDFCAAIFDKDDNFITFVEILSNKSLKGGGYHFANGVSFNYPGTYSLIPGKYHISIYYRPKGGKWKNVNKSSYSNWIPFEVYFENDLELYQDMKISCGNTITQNKPFSVTLDILNDGDSNFNGIVNVALYDLDLNFVKTVQTLNDLSLKPNYYYDDLVFKTNGLDVPTGIYLLATAYKKKDDSWKLTGAYYYSNPIYVSVIESPTSIVEIPNKNSFIIYPNPVTNILNIKIKENKAIKEIEIVNLIGEQFKKIKNPVYSANQLSIPVSNLRVGTYILIIKTSKANHKFKFVNPTWHYLQKKHKNSAIFRVF